MINLKKLIKKNIITILTGILANQIFRESDSFFSQCVLCRNDDQIYNYCANIWVGFVEIVCANAKDKVKKSI